VPYGVRVTSSARPGTPPAGDEDRARGWTFLTNHAHVLLCVAGDGQPTVRELAQRIGITERSVQTILADLVDGGYLTRTRAGRRNLYSVNPAGRLRHPLESAHTVGELIDALR
jgi:DNA-binding transcriptional ArsR family regulator